MHKKIKLSKSNLLLKVVAYVVMGLLAAMAILPCLHIISKAFSRGADVTAGNVVFWPKGFQLETVWYVLTKTSFLNAFYDRRYGNQYVYDDYDGVSSVQAVF